MESAQQDTIKRYFYVDYENVNREGLNGIQNLSENDYVGIYYSGSAGTMDFNTHLKIVSSKANINYIKVTLSIKNAMDCKILFDLEKQTQSNKNVYYYIVSKDGDYDKPIQQFSSNEIKVKKLKNIGQCNNDVKVSNAGAKKTISKREARIRTFFGQHFKDAVYKQKKEDIIKVLLTAKTKQQVNNELMKLYPSDRVSVMIKTMQPLIEKLPGR